MRIHKVYYKKNKKGRPVYSRNWYVEIKDHNQIVRHFAGYTDKHQAQLLGDQLQRLVNCKESGEKPDGQLARFLEGMTQKMRQRLVEIGLLDKISAAAGKQLSAHIDNFYQSLLAKGDTEKQAKQVVSRVNRIVNGCDFQTFISIQPHKAVTYLYNLRIGKENLSARTSNFYLKALKQFCLWMVRDGRAISSPVQYIELLDSNKVKEDERHPRRSLQIDELKRLIATAETGPIRFKNTGHQRAVLYQLAAETGIRENELRQLVVKDFDFENLTVTIRAESAKSSREDKIPLRKQTAKLVEELTTNKMPTATVFNVPEKAVDMLKDDLADAKIAYCDESGRYADFHSLRHTTASLLAAADVHPKVAQTILRHKDIQTTMNIYTHLIGGQERKAVDSLPDLLASTGSEIKVG